MSASTQIASRDLPDVANRVVRNDGLLDLMQESVITYDAGGRITGWNKASERIYGWPRAAVEGRHLEDVVGAPHRLEIEAGTARSSIAGSHQEVTRRTACGREVIVATQLSELADQTGGARSWLETGVDVTSHRRAATTARAEHLHYRNVFQAIPAAVWDIDFSEARAMAVTWLRDADVGPLEWFTARPGKVRELMRSTFVRDVNEQAMSLFGPCSREDLLISIDRYWPDSSLGDFTTWLISALSGEHFFSCETRQRRFDGREFDALFTASFAPGTVEQGRLVVSIVDHSEVKQSQAAVRKSEAFYADLFHASAFSAWHLDAQETKGIYAELRARGVTDLRGYLQENPATLDRLMSAIKVVDVNCTTLKLFEAVDRAEIIGKSVTRFWLPGRLDGFVGSLEASFNDRPIYKCLSRMRTLAGNEIDVLFTRSASSALRSDGQLLLAIVDMTDKVHAQSALAEMQAALSHAARISSLGELTASIAHEVNQPLAAITANGEAALLRLNQAVVNLDHLRDLTKEMISDARRASDIVTHIRSMASPQQGRHQRLSLNAVVEEAMALVGSQIEKCGIIPHVRLAPDLSEISGDAVQLQQVVVNLVLNALHAVGGIIGPQLSLCTMRVSDGVELRVQDNGVGVPPDCLSRLFDSFFTTKSDGMGIGLAICRRIVEAHGGSVSAENVSSRGARFIVRLPTAFEPSLESAECPPSTS